MSKQLLRLNIPVAVVERIYPIVFCNTSMPQPILHIGGQVVRLGKCMGHTVAPAC